MLFSYKARTRDGKTVSGTTEASDKAALVEALGKQGAHPILIHEAKFPIRAADTGPSEPATSARAAASRVPLCDRSRAGRQQGRGASVRSDQPRAAGRALRDESRQHRA